MSMPSDGARFPGAFGDGQSAAARSVQVRVAGGGLELRVDGETRTRVWPYDRLHTSLPLRSDAADVLLTLKGDGAQTLFVADPSFASVLLARSPGLSPLSRRWNGLKPGLAVVAAVAALVGSVWALDLHPAQAVARVMPQQSREVLGGAVIASLAKDRKVCETPASKAALARLATRLTAVASDKPMAVNITLFDWGLVNAFAAPGGQIILTRGLVQQAGSVDEVAGVLAHEMGHTLEMHPEVGIIRAMGLAAAAQLAFAGSSGTVTNVGLLLTQLRYSRIAEREADAHALRILKGAGISHKGFGDFFERLEGKSAGKDIPGLEVVSTHPMTQERIAMVRAQPAYPSTPALTEQEWRALRDACGPAAAPQRPGPTMAANAPHAPSPPPTAGKQEPKPGPKAPPPAAAKKEPQPAAKEAQPPAKEPQQPAKGAQAAAKPAPTPAKDATPAAKEAPPPAKQVPPGKEAPAKEEHAAVRQSPAPPAKQDPQPAAKQSSQAVAKQDIQAERDVADATKALAANAKDVAALQKRARAHARLNQYDSALADYAKAVELKPEDAELQYGRGTALQSLRRYEDALAAYDAALRLTPQHANARNNRGNVNRALKRYTVALQDFDELIRVQPEFIHARYNRGLVYREMDRFEEAVRDFTATIDQDKAYTAAYTSRGMTHERAGARDKAIEDFRAALGAPVKYNNGEWAHTTARARLKALGAD
jgi:predicted Zn-dependent protease